MKKGGYMKTRTILVAAVIGMFLLTMYAQAEYNNSPVQPGSQVVVRGQVVVERDSSGFITSCKIWTDDSAYYVFLDENGYYLGHMMDSRWVVVVGWLTTTDNNQQWLTVAKFMEQD
jgi:hypothetical protein